HGHLEKVRALLGHQRIDTTQIYASIRPTQLKRRGRVLRGENEATARQLRRERAPCLRNFARCTKKSPEQAAVKITKIRKVPPYLKALRRSTAGPGHGSSSAFSRGRRRLTPSFV